MIAGYTGGESIQTSEGEKVIKNILFYNGSLALNDESIGTDESETLQGSSRSETLKGRGGRDIIEGGAEDDVIEGGTQSDKLLGGEGNDTYIYNRGKNYKKYNKLHIYPNTLNNIDLSQNKIINYREIDNIKKCFYLFSNDIWHINIKNRNLLKKVA
ncbi:MAG: hypothetical protein AABY36_00285 [Campylobacterota bacterium]